ncbi:lipopolysaccharide biosynthesis protein [Micromonospora sp. NPDC047753]|uniref:lipopolysaccharide biosynthesis protein n=1 Tax=Micromonospora sp. NPDC047753 TaxID=3154817 RepID=UPI0034087D65
MADTTHAVETRVTRNTASMLAARVIMAVSGLVSVPVIYQRLGPREFGIWVVLAGLLAMAALIDLGLGSALVREVARAESAADRDLVRRLLGLGLGWALLLGLLTLGALGAGWPWLAGLLRLGDLADEAWQATLWLVVGLVAGAVELPWRAVLEGGQRYGSLAAISAGTAILGAALAILVVRLGGGLVALAASAAATGAIRTLLLAATTHRQCPDLSPLWGRTDLADIRRIGGYGLRVQVSSGAGMVNVELDRLVLGGAFGPAVAGGFDLGGRLLNLLRLPPGFALIVLFPAAVARTVSRGTGWLDRFYLAATRYLALFLAPATAALMVSADPLVRLWLGHQVPWAAANIMILAPAYALNLITGAATIAARAEGRPGLETRYVLLSVVLNLVLTVPMLLLCGPLGVPLSTALAVVLSTGYFLVYFHSATARPLAPLARAIWPPLAAAVAAGLVTAAASQFLPGGPGRLDAALAVSSRAGLTVLVAGALLIAGGHLGASDRMRLHRLLHAPTAVLSPSTGGPR